MIKAAWTFLTGGSILEILAGIAFAFVLGFAVGQHSATKDAITSAVDSVADHAAREQAAATQAVILQNKASQKRVDVQHAKELVADDTVHENLKLAAASAENARRAAEESVAKEKAKYDTAMAQIDQMHSAPVLDVNDPRCGWGPDVRRMLDNASGATNPDYPTGGSAKADPAEGAASADSAPPKAPGLRSQAAEERGLSCRELVQGYIDLARHGWIAAGGYAAWQSWWAEAN